jgi:SAM-dependent methyltransferase
MNPAEFAHIAESEQRFWWYSGMNQILFRVLDPFVHGARFRRVLEAGCGTGYLAKLLADRYGWPMYPADLGAEGLAYARGMGLARLTQADIARLPYRDNSFDAVVSMDVIVHFERGQELQPLSELVRVLQPGGLIALRVSALDVLLSRHSMFAHERQRFTRGRLLRVARHCGIRVQRLTYCNSLLLPVALLKFRVWEPWTNQPPASGVEPVHPLLNALLRLPLQAEAAILRAGLNLPLGQSLLLVGRKASRSELQNQA